MTGSESGPMRSKNSASIPLSPMVRPATDRNMNATTRATVRPSPGWIRNKRDSTLTAQGLLRQRIGVTTRIVPAPAGNDASRSLRSSVQDPVSAVGLVGNGLMMRGRDLRCRRACSSRSPLADREDAMAMVTDPVCGMRIDPDDAAATAEHEGKTYYFCSEACRDRFEADPASYAA
jgi:YHS domain-containing protein